MNEKNSITNMSLLAREDNLLGVFGVAIAIVVIINTAGVDVIVIPILWSVLVGLLIFSTPSLIGGIYALQRKNWVIALIGSITSFLIWNIIGLVPLILVIISRDEFNGNKAEIPDTAIDSAKERYAKGEISKEEFEQIRKDII